MFPILRRFDWSEIKSWDALEKAISGLPTQQDRGEAFEEFSAALLKLHKDYYQATKIWRFRNVPDEILERLGCSNRQDGGYRWNDTSLRRHVDRVPIEIPP